MGAQQINEENLLNHEQASELYRSDDSSPAMHSITTRAPPSFVCTRVV